jgi:hypothetical protein
MLFSPTCGTVYSHKRGSGDRVVAVSIDTTFVVTKHHYQYSGEVSFINTHE